MDCSYRQVDKINLVCFLNRYPRILTVLTFATSLKQGFALLKLQNAFIVKHMANPFSGIKDNIMIS